MPSPNTRLLVVDDEPLVCKNMSIIFTALGYATRTALDGFLALAVIREEIPDIILSDLNMPGMSGFEFLSVVRRRFPSVRVIAMSSGFSGADLPNGVAADAFYQKASDPSLLLRIVEDMTRPGQSLVSRRPRVLAPIWIPSNGHNASGEMSVTITCPECLRAFPQTLDRSAIDTLETRCTWCRIPIHCAIVHSATAA